MTKSMRVSRDLVFPEEMAGMTFSVLAQRGAGKSTVLTVMAEEMYRLKIPWVFIDPKGDSWGMRAGADGDPAGGMDVPIFGGLRANFPIEPEAGAEVAQAIYDYNISCILDVSRMRKRELLKFLLGFFDRIYYVHQNAPVLRHLFLEEAHVYIPQEVRGGRGTDNELVPAVKEAASTCVLLGRSFGLGASVASQRSARLHNDVLTQTDTLIALRTLAPADRKPVLEWVKYQGESLDKIAPTLANLADGEAWVWTPPADPVRVQFRPRKTFDSGARPKPGVKRIVATLKDVDEAKLTERFATAVEKMKADDPAELRKTIRRLEKDLAQKKPVEVRVPYNVPVEVPVVLEGLEDEVLALQKTLDRIGNDLSVARDDASSIYGKVKAHGREVRTEGLRGAGDRLDRDPRREEGRVPRRGQLSSARGGEHAGAGVRAAPPRSERAGGPLLDRSEVRLGTGERATLIAVAQHDGGVTPEQLTILTGYKRSSRNTYLQRLGANGLVRREGPRIFATDDGREVLGDDYDPLPTGAALREYWLNKLAGGEREILRVLIKAYPDAVDRETISERTNYTRSSRNTYLQRLGARELVSSNADGVVASDVLFETPAVKDGTSA